MKRDMELIRKLLVFFDERPESNAIEVPKIEGEHDDGVIKYHLNLMYEAGWLVAEPVRSSSSDRVIYVIPFSLSWQGHEFLDAVRNDTIWNKTKDKLKAVGGQAPVEIVKAVATGAIRALLPA